MTKVLIIGAGIGQIYIVQTAKKMGLYVIVVSPKGYPAIEYADELFECDSEFFKNINIVVNATPVGTINYPGKVNIPYEKFENIDIAFDLVYNPCETEFLKTFKELGKQIINGYIMLQNQALKSYKIWKLLKNKPI